MDNLITTICFWGSFLLLFAGLGSFLLTLTRKHGQTRREQINLFLCALGVRFTASVVVYELGLVNVLGDDDSSGWVSGLALSEGWDRQRLDLLSLPEIWGAAYEKQNRGFQYLAGLFFFITGTSARMPLAAMNCFFGALTVILIYRTAISLFSRWTAVRGWMGRLFFPVADHLVGADVERAGGYLSRGAGAIRLYEFEALRVFGEIRSVMRGGDRSVAAIPILRGLSGGRGSGHGAGDPAYRRADR